MQTAVELSEFNKDGIHLCAVKYEEDICTEFIYEKDVGYPGNDIGTFQVRYFSYKNIENFNDRFKVTKGPAECEDICRSFANCTGFSMDPFNLGK